MSLSNGGRLLRRIVAGVVAAAALVSCGGGTEQYDPFEPGRLIVFGDENSLLRDDGHRWSVNSIAKGDDGTAGTADDTFDCAANPIWVQRLASHYGFVFEECNPDDKEVRAFFRSTVNARVTDIEAQVADQIANGGGFRDDDLTTMMVGANDIVDLYVNRGAKSEKDLKDEAAALGERLADQVNRIVGYGARVLLSHVPDMGLTPYARANGAEDLLSAMTEAFNNSLGVHILLDGRRIGLVQSDLRVSQMERSPGSFDLDNVADAACKADPALPECTTLTLVDGATEDGGVHYLWADSTHLGTRAHAEIAEWAIDRAEDNPF